MPKDEEKKLDPKRDKLLADLANDDQELNFEKIDEEEKKFGLDHDTQEEIKEHEGEEEDFVIPPVDDKTKVPIIPPDQMQP